MADTTRTVKTVLDSLPYGTYEDPAANGRVRFRPLPEGVGTRSLLRDAVMIAWPSFIELVLSQLTGMADQIMVGRLPGEEGIMALSAVGLSSQPKFMLMTMMIALNVGATAMIARFRGQQNREKANQAFRMALLMNLSLSILFMVIGIIWDRPLIRIIAGSGITDETFAMAVDYYRIQMIGFVPLCLTFMITASLRGIGDTVTPLIYNTAANVINLFFNYVMIYGHFGCPKMGVIGASWATVIGQTCAFAMAAWAVLNKKHYIYLDFKEKFSFDAGILKSIVSIGIPSMIEQVFMRIGIILYTRQVAGLGDTLYATHQIAMSIQAMSFMVGQAFGTSSTTLTGQCIGKRRYDMAEHYMRTIRMLGLVVSIGLMLALTFFNRQLIGLYNTNAEVIAIGGQILLFLAVVQPFQTDQFIASGGLRAAGDTVYTAGVIFVTTLGVRPLLCWVLVNVAGLSLYGAWIALAVDQTVRSLMMMIRYGRGGWKVRSRQVEK